MIIHFWEKISNIGTMKAASEIEVMQIRVLNQILANSLLWLFFFLFYNIWANNPGGNLLGGLGIALLLTTFFIVYLGKSRLAQHFLFISLGIALAFTVYIGGKSSYCITLYLPTLTLLFLLFRDYEAVYFYYPYYGCSIILSLLFTIYSPDAKFLENPELFSYAILLLSFCMLMIVLHTFRAEIGKKEHLIKQKQDKLKESTFLMNATLESSIDGVYITDRHKETVCANKRFLEMWNIPESVNIKGEPFEKIFHPLMAQLATPEILTEQLNFLDLSQNNNSIKELELLDGRFFEVQTKTIQLDQHKIAGCAYEFRDITEKKLTEQKLIQSEELFRSLFDEMPMGIALGTHLSKTLNQTNNHFKKMLGYSQKELEQKTVDDITHPEERGVHKDNYHKVWHGELELFNMEKKYIRKDNSILWGFTTVAVARDQTGKVKYDIAMIQDITQKKMAEDRIKVLLQELKRKNEELEGKVKARTQSLLDSNEELIRSNHDLEQFAYIASHDLQEPLRTVGNFVQLLDKQYGDSISKEGKVYINFAVDGVHRMSKLIQNLLQYSRVGRKDIEFVNVDLNNIIVQKLQDLMHRIKDSNAEIFIYELPQKIPCEPNQLSIVFYNLLGNALKFNTNKKAIIELSYKERDKDWLFSIKDNGIGIEEQFKDKVFEIFKRLNKREEFEGTGIGLALCKRIINRHNGKIWFNSQPNQGTTFHFTICKELLTGSCGN